MSLWCHSCSTVHRCAILVLIDLLCAASVNRNQLPLNYKCFILNHEIQKPFYFCVDCYLDLMLMRQKINLPRVINHQKNSPLLDIKEGMQFCTLNIILCCASITFGDSGITESDWVWTFQIRINIIIWTKCMLEVWMFSIIVYSFFPFRFLFYTI